MAARHRPLLLILACACNLSSWAAAQEKRPYIAVRGIYGGVPNELLQDGKTLDDYGINAIFMGSGNLKAEQIAELKKQGVRVFAEFNTMHFASYLKDHPEAAPIGVDGKVSPAPHGWQGICPNHKGYRENRMSAFRGALKEFDLDGIWLDYHHSHASWERAEPAMPDTCFCQRCVQRFSEQTNTLLTGESAPDLARQLLNQHRERWLQWRCDVFTDWVRQFRQTVDQTRPNALLGTFHCPWSESDLQGAIRNKLAIDLKAQAKYIDVFSIMPYHARFGHATDPAWISRQTSWLGKHLGIRGTPPETRKIWPIVQLADWGEKVPIEQVRPVLDHATRRPATGVMVFHWGSLRNQRDKVDALSDFYRSIRP